MSLRRYADERAQAPGVGENWPGVCAPWPELIHATEARFGASATSRVSHCCRNRVAHRARHLATAPDAAAPRSREASGYRGSSR